MRLKLSNWRIPCMLMLMVLNYFSVSSKSMDRVPMDGVSFQMDWGEGQCLEGFYNKVLWGEVLKKKKRTKTWHYFHDTSPLVQWSTRQIRSRRLLNHCIGKRREDKWDCMVAPLHSKTTFDIKQILDHSIWNFMDEQNSC